ncbi:MAG: TspO/MBR family protein [Candidatus Komeilibacteria bacterium]
MLKHIISIAICLGAGFVGSFFNSPAIDGWYAGIDKPFFNPPNWIFAPVWTILFILMGIAAAIIWNKGLESDAVKIALMVFIFHLVLNILWSMFFFGMQNPGLAFIEIVVLWLMIILVMYLFYQLDHRAAYLLIPYILWVSFAAVLNYSIWQLN